jgi:hypothetical protein
VSIEGGGAVLSFNEYDYASGPIKATNDKWQYVEFYVAVESGMDQLGVALRLGNFANVCTGKAYFDDVSIEKVKEIPGGKLNYKVGKIVETNQNTVLQPESNGSNTSFPIRTLLTLIFVILGATVFSYNLIMKKPPHDNN